MKSLSLIKELALTNYTIEAFIFKNYKQMVTLGGFFHLNCATGKGKEYLSGSQSKLLPGLQENMKRKYAVSGAAGIGL